VFAAASEAFSQKNINCSMAESLERFRPVVAAALRQGVRVRAYVSCGVHCPFSGAVPPENVAQVAAALYGMGCYEISLGDTTGAGTPASIGRMLDACAAEVPVSALAGHFHDTYGMAVANIYAALQRGVAVFDSSVAGLGGCPYAPGATGNVATEDVVYLLHGLGISTGIDLDALLLASAFICTHLERDTASRSGKALQSTRPRTSPQSG
jgi:hydroxymethylglutaryl-CoA lyase